MLKIDSFRHEHRKCDDQFFREQQSISSFIKRDFSKNHEDTTMTSIIKKNEKHFPNKIYIH